MHTNQLLTLTVGAAMTAGLAQTAQADLLVYEGFNYESLNDPLHGNPDGDAGEVDATGLSGTWADADGGSSGDSMFLKSGSLNFSNLATSGNHIGYLSNNGSDRYNRTLTASAVAGIDNAGTSNGTIYFSFLFEKLQNNFGADHEGLALMNGILPQARWDSGNAGEVGRHGFAVAAVDGSNLQAVAYDGTTGTRVVSTETLPITAVNGGSNTSTSNEAVNLIVGEISFNTGAGGADVFKLYNAADDGSLDAGDLTLIATIEADVDESTLNTLNLTRQVNVNYDEVRFTTTLDEALVIPEPGSLALLGLGGLLIGTRRRRA